MTTPFASTNAGKAAFANSVYSLQSIVPTPPASLKGTGTSEKPEEDFIKLMVAQMQNQDPEKPMDGTALISQLMQMNAAVATQRMSWLSSEQHLVSTAASMLGKTVTAKDPTTGAPVMGKVESIDYNDARPMLRIGGKSYPAESVVEVTG